MEYVKTFDSSINTTLSQFMKKPTIIKGVVHLILMLYAARIAPALPKTVLRLFENQYFKLFVFSLILWTAQFSPSTSILIALAFMVTVNYATEKPLWNFQKPMWELLENTTSGTVMINAPSKEEAMTAAGMVVESQMQNTPVVDGSVQKQETIIIQPSIVQTPDGPAVVNPTVVIAPAIIETPNGEKLVVQPDVTSLSAQGQEVPMMVAPPQEAPPQEAPVMMAAPPQVAPMMMAPPPVIELAPPAPSPAPAPAPTAIKTQVSEPAGCYPIRRYDMSKVSPSELGYAHQEWSR
jgi:hypothetical protein